MTRSIVAEFQKSAGGRLTLFSMTVIEDKGSYLSRTIYDVDHSRAYGYLFHQSGGGGSGPIEVRGPYFVSGSAKVRELKCELVDRNDSPPWRSKRTRAIRERNRTRRLRALPKTFDLAPEQDLLGWLEWNAIQEDAVWCSKCRDTVPGNTLCEHTWWCDKIGWYSTPSEPCGCSSTEDHSR